MALPEFRPLKRHEPWPITEVEIFFMNELSADFVLTFYGVSREYVNGTLIRNALKRRRLPYQNRPWHYNWKIKPEGKYAYVRNR